MHFFKFKIIIIYILIHTQQNVNIGKQNKKEENGGQIEEMEK